MTKRLLQLVLATVATLLAFRLALGIGTYFLDSTFTTNDAAPIADPYTTEPGAQSVDAVETDGTLAASSGYLVVTAQASAVDGDQGLRYTTAVTDYNGKAQFFKVKFTTLATGIAGSGGCANAFGFNTAATVKVDDAVKVGIGTNLANFRFKLTQTSSGFISTPTVPTTTDSFYIAVLMGGHDTATLGTSAPYYTGTGQLMSSYDNGTAVFIKKNTTGKWYLEGICPNSAHATSYAAIANYNSAFKVDEWRVVGDTDSLYTPYLDPLHYQSCGPASGSLYLDTPEVGAIYDSVAGSFVFNTGALFGSGSPPATLAFIATAAMSDSNTFVMIVNNTDDTSTGRGCGLILRRDPSDARFMLVSISTTADAVQIYDFDGTSTFTQRATASIAIPANTTYTKVLSAAIVDSTVYGWFSQTNTGSTASISYTSGLKTQYGQGLTRHGVRINEATTGIKILRFYQIGRDNEYSGLNQYFTDLATSNTKRGRVINVLN